MIKFHAFLIVTAHNISLGLEGWCKICDIFRDCRKPKKGNLQTSKCLKL